VNAALLPLGPVACPSCGWDDHGTLELVDIEREFHPPIPRDAYPPFGVYGDEGRPRPFCPGCDTELDEFTVVARPTSRLESRP
jgi:hypothetical protein